MVGWVKDPGQSVTGDPACPCPDVITLITLPALFQPTYKVTSSFPPTGEPKKTGIRYCMNLPNGIITYIWDESTLGFTRPEGGWCPTICSVTSVRATLKISLKKYLREECPENVSTE